MTKDKKSQSWWTCNDNDITLIKTDEQEGWPPTKEDLNPLFDVHLLFYELLNTSHQ